LTQKELNQKVLISQKCSQKARSGPLPLAAAPAQPDPAAAALAATCFRDTSSCKKKMKKNTTTPVKGTGKTEELLRMMM
jgi:hypothetical protein